jgi:hypothetical protein
MNRNLFKTTTIFLALLLLPPLTTSIAFAEGLNPQSVNPHAEAPRKRISKEQQKAAMDARKKKQSEIAARKAGQPVPAQPDKSSVGAAQQ